MPPYQSPPPGDPECLNLLTFPVPSLYLPCTFPVPSTGDPECLNLLTLLTPETDFLAACEATATGGLARVPLGFAARASVCKYAVPLGYPSKPAKGAPIELPGYMRSTAFLGAVDRSESGQLVLTGSRAVGVVATGADLEEAEGAAEADVASIGGPLFHREDVGTAALVSGRVSHMLALQKARMAGARPLKIGVLGSTRGSSLAAVLRSICGGELEAQLEIVISDKPSAPILRRASLAGIRAVCLKPPAGGRAAYGELLTAELEAAGCDAVLLVGFMRVLSAGFCARWRRRCLNVHPSLLPAHAGGMDLQVHQAVLDASESESGCTVHLVEAEVDAGAAVVQKRCAVRPADTAETLKARVQALEGPALVEALGLIAAEARAAAPAPPAPPPAPAAGSGEVLTYKTAGVDIDAGDALVQAIKPLAAACDRAGSMGKIGGFGGLFDPRAAGYSDPILVSGTDGVGTKLLVAQAAGLHETIGIDLVAMVVNDLIVQGAEPLFFLDYFATGKLDKEEAAAVLRGIAKGCLDSGCALVGGETAEMPGMYAPGHYDLGGFGVGAVERKDLLPHLDEIAPGDVLLGLRSSGVHSNGFSLVRRVVEKLGLEWSDPAPFAPRRSLAEELLTPTVLYVKSCLPACRSGKVKALCHITGGGLLENLPRVLPHNVACHMEASAWTPPPVFGWLAHGSRSGYSEMLRTFNCGLGMVLLVAPADAAAVSAMLHAEGEAAVVVGKLAARAEAADQVVVAGCAEAWGWAS